MLLSTGNKARTADHEVNSNHVIFTLSDKPFQNLPIYLSEQTDLQATDRPGSADGSVYCQPEFKSSGK